MSEFTVAKILKQLALILEENDFVIYYDKRFPSMKPHINDTTPYIAAKRRRPPISIGG